MINIITWYCPKCGHIVISEVKPEPIRWSDGHICHFKLEEKEGEAFEISYQKAKEERKYKERKDYKYE